MKKILLLLILSISSTFASTLYKVEVIAFKNHDKPALEKEIWDTQFTEINLNNTITTEALTEEPEVNKAYQLTSENWTLHSLANTLKSKYYQPLCHNAWQQYLPVGYKNSSIYIKGDNLKGKVAVKKLTGHYHVKVDFAYTAQGQTFRLTKYGNLKLGKMYYFDHPAFGVIVKVSS